MNDRGGFRHVAAYFSGISLSEGGDGVSALHPGGSMDEVQVARKHVKEHIQRLQTKLWDLRDKELDYIEGVSSEYGLLTHLERDELEKVINAVVSASSGVLRLRENYERRS
jgi:hypothetical protein